jgi:hypothetical protein
MNAFPFNRWRPFVTNQVSLRANPHIQPTLLRGVDDAHR